MKDLMSIGEIAKKLGVQSHTIRFWTEEFGEYLKFELGKGDRRYYPEESVAVFTRIRDLIHSEGVKIRVIKEKKLLLQQVKSPFSLESVAEIKKLLEEAIDHLNLVER